MRHVEVKVPALAAVGIIVGVLLAIHLWKAPEFRRDWGLETLAFFGATPTYRAYYADYTDGRDTGLLGFFSRNFTAESDDEAIAFARSALPACRLYMLQRKRRGYFEGGFSVDRRVDIDLR